MVERGVEMGTSSEVKLPGWRKPANRLIIALQRLGLAVGTMHLISVPGRKSSKIRTTPVSPLTVDGQRYIVGGFERADWVKNARAAGWGILARGRKEERVRWWSFRSRSVLRYSGSSPARYPTGCSSSAGCTESPEIRRSSR